jgi:hypothetical protein
MPLLLIYNRDAKPEAKAWDSSKGRIFRIKTSLAFIAARVVVCTATL